MLNVYCWRCGTQIGESNVLGLGHFDRKIGKYQGKEFIAYRCPQCQKVRYQVLDKRGLPRQIKALKNPENFRGGRPNLEQSEIDINQVIDFYEVLNDIDTVNGFLEKCRLSGNINTPEINKPIVQPLDVFNIFNDFNNLNMKRLMVLTLDKDNYLVSWEFMGEGTDRPISFKPRDIYHTPFLLDQEVSVLIAENLKEHFSKPSQKDLLITKRLIKTGKILGIEFLDHIVIEENGFHSYDKMDLI